jgi:hypothetical protein
VTETAATTEPISDPGYWAARLRAARASGNLHHAVFRCPADRWARIEAKHREVLAATLHIDDRILDAGCGWGRLLDLTPPWWVGDYVGVDLCPDFIGLAKQRHPGRSFIRGDLRRLPELVGIYFYDWAVLVSIRPMVRRNLGDAAWAEMEAGLRRVARNLLFLEYDCDDPGSVE